VNSFFWFIVSKDRPLQLDALLRSMLESVSPVAPVVVLVKASSERYQNAYGMVLERHRRAIALWRHETDFSRDVLEILGSSGTDSLAFLVDDQVFIAPVDLRKILRVDARQATYSFRLGRRIVRCQPLGDAVTGTPPFIQLPNLPHYWLAWRWVTGAGDWRSAHCLDGNVLSRPTILAALQAPSALPFAGPQSLEYVLHHTAKAPEFGFCGLEPQVVNLAVNRVSAEPMWYPHGTTSLPDILLDSWERGYEMDLTAVRVLKPDTCHVICDVPLQRRTR
jgi:hypothetical protein